MSSPEKHELSSEAKSNLARKRKAAGDTESDSPGVKRLRLAGVTEERLEAWANKQLGSQQVLQELVSELDEIRTQAAENDQSTVYVMLCHVTASSSGPEVELVGTYRTLANANERALTFLRRDHDMSRIWVREEDQVNEGDFWCRWKIESDSVVLTEVTRGGERTVKVVKQVVLEDTAALEPTDGLDSDPPSRESTVDREMAEALFTID